MKIQLINYGYKNAPKRAHYNDAGADVYSTKDITLDGNSSTKIPLGFGIKLPDGYVAYVCPRSGLSTRGLTCELAPIDSGYTGEIHAIVTNNTELTFIIKEGDRIGQLVVLPCVLPEFVEDLSSENSRGADGFGSTGN